MDYLRRREGHQGRELSIFILVGVQLLSLVQFSVTPWTAAHKASPSFTISQNLLKFMSMESVMLPNHLILCCLLLWPSIFPSIRVFSSELVLHIRWPKYWSFSFRISISPSNEHPGLISLRMDWLDLLAVQGTLKSLLQQHSSKASVRLGNEEPNPRPSYALSKSLFPFLEKKVEACLSALCSPKNR